MYACTHSDDIIDNQPMARQTDWQRHLLIPMNGSHQKMMALHMTM